MRLSVAVLVAAALVACKKPEKPAQAAQAPAAAQPASQVMQGKILEKLEAPPYSYLKLQTASGEVWTAVPATQVAVGTDFTVANAFPMQNFDSKALGRKFDVVYFGQAPQAGMPAGHGPGDGHDHGPAQAMPAGMGGGMGGGAAPQMGSEQLAEQHKRASAGPADAKVEKVAKAAGADGRTVAEVWAQKAKLADKSVTINAQVVKYSPNIMGKNWLHIRDGSGDAAKNDHDLTVTTMDEAKVGEIVTVKGLVRADKNFGAGYAYPVIVEDAKVAKK
jgi:hypothetical protein